MKCLSHSLVLRSLSNNERKGELLRVKRREREREEKEGSDRVAVTMAGGRLCDSSGKHTSRSEKTINNYMLSH